MKLILVKVIPIFHTFEAFQSPKTSPHHCRQYEDEEDGDVTTERRRDPCRKNNCIETLISFIVLQTYYRSCPHRFYLNKQFVSISS